MSTGENINRNNQWELQNVKKQSFYAKITDLIKTLPKDSGERNFSLIKTLRL